LTLCIESGRLRLARRAGVRHKSKVVDSIRSARREAAPLGDALQLRSGPAVRPGGMASVPPSQILRLQRTAGNRGTAAYLAGRTPVQREFEDQGEQTGTASSEGEPIHEHAETATPKASKESPFGEFDGEVTSDVVPHVFVNGGKTGSGLVNWAGGNGGAGNQGVGAITLVAPNYQTAAPSAPGKSAKAWIQSGTGKAKVTRSFRGVQRGANGTYYFTRRAVARADVHERLHVNSSRSIHDLNIAPLQTRVGRHKGARKAMKAGTTPAEALAALTTFIDWNTHVNAFTTQDTAANTPMGTVDTTDMNRADFVRSYGPRTVSGVNYASYIDTPPGP
jgi:hypothetical protein